mmetsp:Transcript_6384/g.16639  ORF Transcript_6384/g.16639 Transcript_6384/m.16639 type:complete len:510 (-) Transcript_6384:487-2016(-)
MGASRAAELSARQRLTPPVYNPAPNIPLATMSRKTTTNPWSYTTLGLILACVMLLSACAGVVLGPILAAKSSSSSLGGAGKTQYTAPSIHGPDKRNVVDQAVELRSDVAKSEAIEPAPEKVASVEEFKSLIKKTPITTVEVGVAPKNPVFEKWSPASGSSERMKEFEPLVDDFLAGFNSKNTHPDIIRKFYPGKLATVCVLVEIKAGEFNITRTFSPTKHGRYLSFEALTKAMETKYGANLPDATFMVMLNDGFRPNVPLFGAAKMWPDWFNFAPIPLGNSRGMAEGFGTAFSGWDHYVNKTYWASHERYPWDRKIPKALFRGNFAFQTHTLGSCNKRACARATDWKTVNRGTMYTVANTRKDLFDVGFTKKGGGNKGDISEVPVGASVVRFLDHQMFKYLLNVGANQDWAERLRNFLFMNSAIIRHEAYCREWFYPLLKPFVHYIPTDIMFDDLIERVEWANSHDDEVKKIVKNANDFAREYLSQEAMMEYFFVLLQKYAKIQSGGGK